MPILLGGAIIAFGSNVAAQPKPTNNVWRLAWSDNFARTELGTNWFVRSGEATIRDGRLYLSGAGATLLSERTFGPDVKMEFIAEANPDLPPCDLSATLCANRLFGWTYLFAFGGRNNQVNQLLSASQRVVDQHPPFLIEAGRKYRLTAVKEGKRLSYFVDGRKILEAVDDDPVGGPGFDRAGLVTWNGMWVDEVNIYERVPPAPDGPRILRTLPDAGYRWQNRKLTYFGSSNQPIARAIAAYNSERFRNAFDQLASIKPPTLASVVGLAWVLGDLNYQDRPDDQRQLAALANTVAQERSNDQPAKDFALAADWFARVSLRSRDRRAVTRLVSIGPDHNPFYYKASLFRARYHYASAREGADQHRVREALDLFAELKALWPESLPLREFAGERVLWRNDLIWPESAGPAWARYLQEAFARQHAILDWWFTQRQAPDGSLGGGWGDDVEILRSWVPVACITSAGTTALNGIEKLADGVWKHDLKDGYEPGVGDVEHSAEPSADTLPTMLLLRYGDPLWIERNLRSARTIREKFMAMNQRGHLQFISSEFGADGVNTHPRAGGDTGYHARAMKHFLWLAWWGVPEASNTFLEWCDTWRDATMRRIGSKPPGFAPASIFYPSGGIEPPIGRPWFDPAANFYGFPGLPTMVHDALLTANFLSGDRRFLEPVQSMLDQATTGPLLSFNDQLPPDHPDNLRSHIVHEATPNITAVYHWLTGERVYDEYTLRRCTARQRFEVNGDRVQYEASFQRLAESMRYRWTQRTSEVLQTDRAGLEGATTVLEAYTGAVRDFRDASTPSMAVTWITPDLNFAALVTEATPQRLRVRLYNFNGTPQRMALRPWRLESGVYVFHAGEAVSAERPGLERYLWGAPSDVELRHRAAPLWFELPPQKVWVVDMRLRQSITNSPALPDLAIAARDVRLESNRVSVTVHNIGAAAAKNFSVAIEQSTAGNWSRLAKTTVDRLDSIHNFQPSTRTVTFPMPDRPNIE